MAELRLTLDDAYHWEKTMPDRVWMTQPVGDGKVETYTWAQAMDQVRRMAAHLQSLGLEPGTQIGLISKNCAHFILADLAIWMAGHVSVALYPTLNADTIEYILDHSESKLLFVGKLDGWSEIEKGIPKEMPCISLPLAPPNDYETVGLHRRQDGATPGHATEKARRARHHRVHVGKHRPTERGHAQLRSDREVGRGSGGRVPCDARRSHVVLPASCPRVRAVLCRDTEPP